jgi:hypothetical protein
VVAAMAVRRRLTSALRLVAACFAVMFVQDAAGWWMAERNVNNLWIGHVGRPLQTLLLLFAFSEWQMGDTERRAVRLAGLGFLLLWVALLAGFEDPRAFSRFGQPLQAILVVSVVAWTMVRRTALTFEAPLAEPWFWVGAGLLLYFGSSAVVGPVSRLLLPSGAELVRLVYFVKAIVNIVAYLLVARGVLCSLPNGSSGGSWWRPRSSPSSSAPPSSLRFSSSSAVS